MKTIEIFGEPHNVDDAVASEILNARQAKKANEESKKAMTMAEEAIAISAEAANQIHILSRHETPMYLDSLEVAEGLHQDGLLDTLTIGGESVYITPRFAQELRQDGLLIEVHTDAKCSGRGWMPGGPNGKCKRVPKGSAKKVKAETAGIDRIAKGGGKNKARSARIKELRAKLSAKGRANRKAGKALGKEIKETLNKKAKKSKKYKEAQGRGARINAKSNAIDNAKARAKAAGDRTSPARKRKKK